MGHSPENWTKEGAFPDEIKMKLKHECYRYISDVMCLEK